MNETIVNSTVNQSTVESINQTLITLLGAPLPVTSNPVLDIFIVTIFASLFVTLIHKYMSDQVAIKALRKEMKELQKKAREHMTKDPKKAQEYQQKMMKKNFENMKHAMNPKIMLITMLPMLLLFLFVKTYYAHFGEILNLGFTEFTWLGTYILFSIINSIILRKILDVS